MAPPSGHGLGRPINAAERGGVVYRSLHLPPNSPCCCIYIYHTHKLYYKRRRRRTKCCVLCVCCIQLLQTTLWCSRSVAPCIRIVHGGEQRTPADRPGPCRGPCQHGTSTRWVGGGPFLRLSLPSSSPSGVWRRRRSLSEVAHASQTDASVAFNHAIYYTLWWWSNYRPNFEFFFLPLVF